MEDITFYRVVLEHVQKQFNESYVTSDKYKLEFDVDYFVVLLMLSIFDLPHVLGNSKKLKKSFNRNTRVQGELNLELSQLSSL